MKRSICAAAAVLFGVNVSYAGTGALESLRGSVPPSVLEQYKDIKAPAVSTGAPVSSDFDRFWEKLKDGTVDSVCKAAQLKLNENAKLVNVAGIGGGFGRYMQRFPNEKIALVDEVDVKLSATLGNDILQIPNVPGLGVNISAQLEGKSQVVRPLESDRYCKELGTLVKLYEIKTAIPSTAKRVSAMKTGEIWKLPLTLHLGFGASIGTAINEMLNVSISAGETKERRPSVTLYRMDDDHLRLRVRLDRITVQSLGASASSVQIPMSDLGLWDADNILANFVNKTWANAINRYIATQLSLGYSRNFGKKLLVEFVLNPKNPGQMEILEKFFLGDFSILKRFVDLGLHFNNFAENDETANGLGDITDAANQASQGVGSKPGFAGSDIYHGHSTNLHMQVPLLHAQDVSWSTSYNRYQSLEKQGETLHVQQRTRYSDGRSVNLPVLGSERKYNSQKTVYVVNKESADGKATRPAMMYQQNEGFVRHSDDTARDMLEKANGVLRYVGMNGNGTNESEVLPSAEIFPGTGGTFKYYKTGVMNFKLLISEQGVQDIIMAPAQAIMKAYINMMREFVPGIIDKVTDLFYVNKDGKVGYDSREAAKRVGGTSADYENPVKPVDVVKQLALGATEFIQQLASVRNAGGWKEQSENLAKVAAGSSRSGLSYEDFLKVVVQVTDPLHVSAEVFVHTDKKVKGEADVTQNYKFFNCRDNSFDANIAEVNQMQARFADPSTLTD
ncbi:MAG: hypothetical protein NTY45_07175 [Elusimicrobia bacterium]|nr:hypothetical protein [Elusimicrobiota bacterium]